MATVLLIGTLDTKGPETAYLRDCVRELGCNTLVLDSGILGEAVGIEADFTRAQVAIAAGSSIDALRNAGSRGKAVEGMLKGVRKLTLELMAADSIHGAVALGGAEGSVLAAARVKGIQGDLSDDQHILACVKHFAAYGAAEAGREYNTVDLSRYALWNYYLPPYQAAVNAGAATVMNSFNIKLSSVFNPQITKTYRFFNLFK